MARLHPADRVSTDRARARPLSQRKIHPSLCLMAGFGFIVASALVVHMTFEMLF